MLTEKQGWILEEMLKSIKKQENLLLSSKERNIGKTFTLNQLALTLQALGYKVYMLTPYRGQEYYADRFISLLEKDYDGLFYDSVVVIVDESRYIMMNDFLEYCKYRDVPVVGYIDYQNYKTIVDLSETSNQSNFKAEYECEWLK